MVEKVVGAFVPLEVQFQAPPATSKALKGAGQALKDGLCLIGGGCLGVFIVIMLMVFLPILPGDH